MTRKDSLYSDTFPKSGWLALMLMRAEVVLLVMACAAVCLSGESATQDGETGTNLSSPDGQQGPCECEQLWARLSDPTDERWSYLRPVWPPDSVLEEGNPFRLPDDRRHSFVRTRPGWVRYANERYGFSVEIPIGWYRGGPPTNGDGLSFISPDGLAEIAFYGFNNVADGSNNLGLQTLQEYTGGRGRPIVVDSRWGSDIVGLAPGEASAGRGDCIESRWIVLLGERSGRGILMTVPRPLLPEYTRFLDEVIKTYEGGGLD